MLVACLTLTSFLLTCLMTHSWSSFVMTLSFFKRRSLMWAPQGPRSNNNHMTLSIMLKSSGEQLPLVSGGIAPALDERWHIEHQAECHHDDDLCRKKQFLHRKTISDQDACSGISDDMREACCCVAILSSAIRWLAETSSKELVHVCVCESCGGRMTIDDGHEKAEGGH